MRQYEITGCSTDHWTVEQIKDALSRSGAKDVGERCAFGWDNQPLVATFYAKSHTEADTLCDAARELLTDVPFPRLPSLIAWPVNDCVSL